MSALRALVAPLAAAAIACGCASPPGAPEAPRAQAGAAVLRNADFDAAPIPGRGCPPAWWCTAHADPASFRFSLATDARAGGRYLEIRREKPEPWAKAMQAIDAKGLSGRRLRLSVAVNTEALDGEAGPMVVLQGAGGGVLDSRQALVGRGPGWRRSTVEIDVTARTEVVEIGLVVNGGGTVGFDAVDLRVLP